MSYEYIFFDFGLGSDSGPCTFNPEGLEGASTHALLVGLLSFDQQGLGSGRAILGLRHVDPRLMRAIPCRASLARFFFQRIWFADKDSLGWFTLLSFRRVWQIWHLPPPEPVWGREHPFVPQSPTSINNFRNHKLPYACARTTNITDVVGVENLL